MTLYFFDTNICVYYLNGTYLHIKERIEAESLENIKLPVIVAAELYYGACKSARREYNIQRLEQFVSIFDIVPFTETAAKLYGEIRASLEEIGKPIGWNDVFIAATAIAHGATLVTHNTKEFLRVGGLSIEDWTVN